MEEGPAQKVRHRLAVAARRRHKEAGGQTGARLVLLLQWQRWATCCPLAALCLGPPANKSTITLDPSSASGPAADWQHRESRSRSWIANTKGPSTRQSCGPGQCGAEPVSGFELVSGLELVLSQLLRQSSGGTRANRRPRKSLFFFFLFAMMAKHLHELLPKLLGQSQRKKMVLSKLTGCALAPLLKPPPSARN